MSKWMDACAPDIDVVISTRVRLARNVADIPFPAKDTPEQRASVAETAKACAGAGFDFIKMSAISDTERCSLVERHLISAELAQSDDGAVLVSGDTKRSVMINEEDHLRIQSLEAGFAPMEAYAAADTLDDTIAAGIPYAWSQRYGYLTSCPTNTGTGLRLSVMAHLYALDTAGRTRGYAAALSKLGLTVRGMFGEGSAAEAHVYQISNETTLGVSESEIIENLSDAIGQVTAAERTARRRLYSADRMGTEDMCLRSLGILKYAVRLTTDELMEYASNLALGVSLGIIPDITMAQAYELMLSYTPAVMALAGAKTAEQRDIKRASAVRAALNG